MAYTIHIEHNFLWTIYIDCINVSSSTSNNLFDDATGFTCIICSLIFVISSRNTDLFLLCLLSPLALLQQQLLIASLWRHWMFSVYQLKSCYLLHVWFVEGHSVKISLWSVLQISKKHKLLHLVDMECVIQILYISWTIASLVFDFTKPAAEYQGPESVNYKIQILFWTYSFKSIQTTSFNVLAKGSFTTGLKYVLLYLLLHWPKLSLIIWSGVDAKGLCALHDAYSIIYD